VNAMADPSASLAWLSAHRLAELLARRDVSAQEVLEAAISRIEAQDGALNAVVVRDYAEARKAALLADWRLDHGERRPLLGVPITVKESFLVRGLETTWGFPAARANPAAGDSAAVQRLRHAGAIIVGKTNVCTALSDWQCDNPVYGRTNNPWDLSRTTGGSSGGSAAALAAGFSYLEMGSDVAGSIRVPASYCGVYGHRSSAGLVSSQGHHLPGSLTGSELGVIGPLARTADDLRLALSVLAGPGTPEADAWRVQLPSPRWQSLAECRVLLLDTHPLVYTSAAVRSAVQNVADTLANSGGKVARHSEVLPDLAASAECFARLLLIQNLSKMSPEQAQALHYDSTAGGGERLMAIGKKSAMAGARAWFEAQEERARLTQQWRRCFQDWDLVVCPSTTTTAFPHDDADPARRRLQVDGQTCSYFDHLAWVGMASVAGLPATQFPCGLDEQGLPVGLQVMGAPYADLSTIGFAGLLERELGGFRAPPL